MKPCPICEKPDCLGHTPGEAAKILVKQRTELRARVAELEGMLGRIVDADEVDALILEAKTLLKRK